MKRLLICLPLLVLAPTACFLGNYLGGAGIIPEGLGFFASAVAMFILPWFIAIICAILTAKKFPLRILFFLFALVVQGLLFDLVPAGATSQMMGIAHRLQGEFSPEELRDCARQLRLGYHEKTLYVNAPAKGDNLYHINSSAVSVPERELPNTLRGCFERVFIQRSPDTGEEEVVFAIGPEEGIICDDRKNVRELFACSMADGVEAYRYERK